MNTQLLQELCAIHGPSGEEYAVKEYIKQYVKAHSGSWKTVPKVIEGEEFQDCLILEFGKPRAAIFAHMDTTGFTVRYENQLIPIGGPDAAKDDLLVGRDSIGEIETPIKINKKGHHFHHFGRAIDRGTSLVYKPNFKANKSSITSPYLDNRLGVYLALQLAESLTDGALVFSCWEEHGGGSVPYLIRYLHEKHALRYGLICDVTWVTDGVHHGEGAVISMRDRNIPRRSFVDRVTAIAESEGVHYQLEVESGGSSDGRELQISPYPIDWCFLGIPQTDPHSSKEKVMISDIKSLQSLLHTLMKEL